MVFVISVKQRYCQHFIHRIILITLDNPKKKNKNPPPKSLKRSLGSNSVALSGLKSSSGGTSSLANSRHRNRSGRASSASSSEKRKRKDRTR